MNAALRAVAGLITGMSVIGVVGCSPAGSHVLGQSPGDSPLPVASIRDHPGEGSVTVRGVMIEKCPEAGCWFVLRDPTGTIRVDTKTAGFVVLEVPLNRPLTVVGQVFTNGTQIQLAASGVRY